MKSLLIFSGKGKSDQSALVCSLAYTATVHYGEKVAIIDANPRQDASYWAKIYKEQMHEDLVIEPGHISCVFEYVKRIETLEVRPDLVMISVGVSEKLNLAEAAANAVDLVLIPCHSTLFDVWAIDTPVRAAAESGTPTLLVLNVISGRKRWQKDVENYLSKWLKSYPNIEKVPAKLESYEVFVHSLAQGKVSQVSDNSSEIERSTQEIIDLYQYIKERCTST